MVQYKGDYNSAYKDGVTNGNDKRIQYNPQVSDDGNFDNLSNSSLQRIAVC